MLSAHRQCWCTKYLDARLASAIIAVKPHPSPSNSSAKRIKARRLKLATLASLSSAAAPMRQVSRRSREAIGPPSFRWIRCARKNQDPKTSKTRRLQITDGANKDNDASKRTHSGSLLCAVDAERGRARVVKRPLQAALARSGGEHPTQLAVYVERGSLHAAGLQKSDRSSSRGVGVV